MEKAPPDRASESAGNLAERSQDLTCTLALLSYDERDNLIRLIPEIPLERFDSVIAIDPGSTDGTLDVYAANDIPVLLQDRFGRGNAFQLAAEKVKTDLVIFFSTDGNENPHDLPKVLDLLRQGFDVVVAGRFLLRGSATDDSDDPFRVRKWCGILGGLVVRVLWGSQVRDPINGYRGFRTHALRRMQLDAEFHEIELQSTIRAAKLGMSVTEFPTVEQKRYSGKYRDTARTGTLLYSLGRSLAREVVIGKRF